LMQEWFFAGDPIGNRIGYYRTERRVECEAMARRLLESIEPQTGNTPHGAVAD
jgi:hypothetical protein